ncbi:Cupin domain-containing protein [Sphingomonas guangdongensis]|uniref:Cupin domain-containing protein n=1 Tax=Sphingomonas guangdongensis TaxID=1141890 RepID=A0A285R247_9SPHN|nr:cupin domain-containing protein [Sphingomonas guangdongensis]SOB88186.1 Cupin domain-containing protein [Sphingomonas guangdongensis]
MSEESDRLREMAAHQGLKLRTSRRRKPGGDFGRYGLSDAAGKAVFGIGEDGLEATPAAIERFLRDRTRSTWQRSTKGLKRVKATPAPDPPPPPPPRFRPTIGNLYAKLPSARRAEGFTALIERPGCRIERIVSAGQVTPADTPKVQPHDEWVVVLAGDAGMRIADSDEVTLRAGDHLLIAADQPHWVTRTSADPPTVWLAVHLA